MCFRETHLDEVFIVGGYLYIYILFKGCSVLPYNLKMYKLKRNVLQHFNPTCISVQPEKENRIEIANYADHSPETPATRCSAIHADVIMNRHEVYEAPTGSITD